MIPPPAYRAHRVEDLPLAEIAARFKGVLLDVDNTLVPHHGTEIPERRWLWVGSLVEAGVRVALASNATQTRVEELERRWGLPAFVAWKPLPFGIRKWMRTWGLAPDDVLLIGDQVLTDHLAALGAGISSALVKPLTDRDFILTRWVSRKIEAWIYNRWPPSPGEPE